MNQLSKREQEIYDLLVTGQSNKEIASKVFITVGGVKFHLTNMYRKLGVKDVKRGARVREKVIAQHYQK